MYFPKDLSEIENLLKSSTISTSEKLEIINHTISNPERLINKENILYFFKSENKIIEFCEWLKFYKKELENKSCHCISYDVKAYKGLYIFILSHPKNNAIASAEIFSRINYLDKMTRDVTFIVPGYQRGNKDVDIVNTDRNLQLTFNENLFIEYIQQLEDSSKGKFNYQDDCELLIIGHTDEGYDFDNYIRLNLSTLPIDPIKLIISIAQKFQGLTGKLENIKSLIQPVVEQLINSDFRKYKVFIAGAKKLITERALFREELCKIQNNNNVDIRSLTFEDFPTSLKGDIGGRQSDYNEFINNNADVVIFVFDSVAGEITKEEFDVAYQALLMNKKPNIFVYVRKNRWFPNLFPNKRLNEIKKKIYGYNKEYYIEYKNLDHLRYLFFKDMNILFQDKK